MIILRDYIMSDNIIFEVGGRYRNRLGWYEVLDIAGNRLKVRYESDGRIDDLEIAMQKRIIQNISSEERRITPYFDHKSNEDFFRTLGFLCKRGFIEAIIPYRSKIGFDKTFLGIKGRLPQHNEQGYYVHNDPAVDKWGVEMRLTFPMRDTIGIDLGGSYIPVKSPDPAKLRVNSNELCYRLFALGFNLGENHDVERIKANVPEIYKPAFEEGVKLR